MKIVKEEKSEKQKRLEKALRENLRKRKSQQRDRESKENDPKPSEQNHPILKN